VIEHIIRIRTEQIDAPWRKIEPGSFQSKRPGYITAYCEEHSWFWVNQFYNGNDFLLVRMHVDNLIAEHTDHRRLIEVSDEELRRLIRQRAAVVDQYHGAASKGLRNGAGPRRRRGGGMGSDRGRH
jgi:hypothetical protein